MCWNMTKERLVEVREGQYNKEAIQLLFQLLASVGESRLFLDTLMHRCFGCHTKQSSATGIYFPLWLTIQESWSDNRIVLQSRKKERNLFSIFIQLYSVVPSFLTFSPSLAFMSCAFFHLFLFTSSCLHHTHTRTRTRTHTHRMHYLPISQYTVHHV